VKKLIILLVLLILLLGGAGGGAYWWFFLREGANEALPEKAPPPPPPVFVEMEALTVPVIRGGAVAKYVLLKVTLEVDGQAARADVMDRMPRLKDAFLRDLHAYFASVPLDSPLNVRTVKQRLQRVADKYAGRGVVEDILIQGAYEKKN
jgi:flagellar FliL protein